MTWIVGIGIALTIVGLALWRLIRIGAAEDEQEEYDHEAMDEEAFTEAREGADAESSTGGAADGGSGGDGD